MKLATISLLTLLCAAACTTTSARDQDDDDGGNRSATGGAGGGSSAQSDPGGPEVQSIFASPARLENNAATVITVQLTDPDGLDDVVGGLLVAEEAGEVIRPFIQVSGGTFSVNLDWYDLDKTVGVEFVSEQTYRLRAEFTDAAGHRGWSTIDVTLACDVAACGGSCIDSEYDQDECETCDESATCASLLYNESPPPPSSQLCPVSRQIFDALADCACSQCNAACGDTGYCGGSSAPSYACQDCAYDICYDEINACGG